MKENKQPLQIAKCHFNKQPKYVLFYLPIWAFCDYLHNSFYAFYSLQHQVNPLQTNQILQVIIHFLQAECFQHPSILPSTLLLHYPHIDLRSSNQIFMIMTKLFKFSMLRQQCLKPMIFPTMLKILFVLICEPTMPIIDMQKNQYSKTDVHVLPTNSKDWKFHLVI